MVGPTGSGKTTLLLGLMGQLKRKGFKPGHNAPAVAGGEATEEEIKKAQELAVGGAGGDERVDTRKRGVVNTRGGNGARFFFTRPAAVPPLSQPQPPCPGQRRRGGGASLAAIVAASLAGALPSAAACFATGEATMLTVINTEENNCNVGVQQPLA